MTFDIQDILGFLPHRYPFLLIDRIIEFERMKRVVALKNVTIGRRSRFITWLLRRFMRPWTGCVRPAGRQTSSGWMRSSAASARSRRCHPFGSKS